MAWCLMASWTLSYELVYMIQLKNKSNTNYFCISSKESLLCHGFFQFKHIFYLVQKIVCHILCLQSAMLWQSSLDLYRLFLLKINVLCLFYRRIENPLYRWDFSISTSSQSDATESAIHWCYHKDRNENQFIFKFVFDITQKTIIKHK